MLFGRVSRKIVLAHPKPNSSIFSEQMKQKKCFLAANTQDRFGEKRVKKYPLSTMMYTAVILMLWAYISAGGPGHLV